MEGVSKMLMNTFSTSTMKILIIYQVSDQYEDIKSCQHHWKCLKYQKVVLGSRFSSYECWQQYAFPAVVHRSVKLFFLCLFLRPSLGKFGVFAPHTLYVFQNVQSVAHLRDSHFLDIPLACPTEGAIRVIGPGGTEDCSDDTAEGGTEVSPLCFQRVFHARPICVPCVTAM